VPSNPKDFTVLFADRSRHKEAQIWMFHPFIAKESLHPFEAVDLQKHVAGALFFLKELHVPQAPGWPFEPLLKFGCLHTYLGNALITISTRYGAVKHDTNWNHFVIPLHNDRHAPALPEGFRISSVPVEQLDIVISTSGIPRLRETLMALPSRGILDAEGRLVAWAFVDNDGSLATLYVLPEHRGEGFATVVAASLLDALRDGVFNEGFGIEGKASLPFGQASGWIHTEIKVGNVASENVVKRLGAQLKGQSRYIFVDGDLIDI
jgi:GNAT superfamily N-acetyltransferase